jgi:hypothetical protein
MNVSLEIFAGHAEVQMRYDLLDCRIDICSPEVIPSLVYPINKFFRYYYYLQIILIIKNYDKTLSKESSQMIY